MSRTYTDCTLITVNLEDNCGTSHNKCVDVMMEYIVDVDCHYGEDADGYRGTTLIEYDVLDAWIEPEQLITLTASEAEQAIAVATERFNSRQKHFI